MRFAPLCGEHLDYSPMDSGVAQEFKKTQSLCPHTRTPRWLGATMSPWSLRLLCIHALVLTAAAATPSATRLRGSHLFRIRETQWVNATVKKHRAAATSQFDGTVTVYVLDSGIRTSHAWFQRHVVMHGASSVYRSQASAPQHDSLGHGTHVASVAARLSPNQTAFVPVTVIDSSGKGTSAWLQSAMSWVLQTHRRSRSRGIVLLSLSSVAERRDVVHQPSVATRLLDALDFAYSLVFADATTRLVTQAIREDLIVVSAAGNANTGASPRPPTLKH